MVGAQLRDEAGVVIGTHGFDLDVTTAERAAEQRNSAAVEEISENRAAIEQAKGMLSLRYGVDDSTARNFHCGRSTTKC